MSTGLRSRSSPEWFSSMARESREVQQSLIFRGDGAAVTHRMLSLRCRLPLLVQRFPLLHITSFQQCPSSVSRKTWTHAHSFFAHHPGTLYTQGSVLLESRRKTGDTTTLIRLTVGDGARQCCVDEMEVRRWIKHRVCEAMMVPLRGTYPSS